jgi:hypothetical protein
VWDSLGPRYRDFGIEVPSPTVEQFWTQVTVFGIDEVDMIKLDCEGAEYLITSTLSALGLMDRLGWIQGEWHRRKDNPLLASLFGQTHIFNIDSINFLRTVRFLRGRRHQRRRQDFDQLKTTAFAGVIFLPRRELRPRTKLDKNRPGFLDTGV